MDDNEITPPGSGLVRKKPRRTPGTDLVFEHGKIPPQAVDLEEAVLGAMMLEKDKLGLVIELLKPEMFYKSEHQLIFASIIRLFNKSKPVDILTVTDDLRETGELELVGGAYYIAQLTNRVASSANIEFHSRIIIQKHIQRELIRISSVVIKDAFEDTTDVFDLLERSEKGLMQISQGTSKKNFRHVKLAFQDYIKQLADIQKNKGRMLGIPCGYPEIDRCTGGWQNSDLIIVASRPSMGKTALALNMARNTAVDFQIPVGFFSLEMSEKQLIQRLTSMETDIRSEKLRNADLEDYEWERINARTGKVINSNIYFDDTAAISILEFKAKARRMVSSHGVKLIIIDYLQLMRGTEKGRENREREVSEISQALKATAKELDIPIIAISQLSREVEKRLNKRPILSDLRESGSIEQDSDIVIFLYRPAYYMTEKDDGYDEFKRQLQISVAKHRNGQTRSDIMLDFIAEFTKITSPGYTETQIQAF